MKIRLREEVYLRILTLADLADYHSFLQLNRQNLQAYFPITLKETATLEGTKNYLQGLINQFKEKNYFPFGIFENDQLIGFVSVKNIDWKTAKAELAYAIDTKNEGRGISSKAVSKLIQFCFEELELNKLFARISPKNIRSIRIVQKNNFILEGTLRAEFKVHTGELIDVMYFGLLKDK